MQKIIEVDGLPQPVMLTRRKGTRHLRITVKNDGSLRLSVPFGTPEFMAKRFLLERIDWIQKNIKPTSIIANGSHIGKSHRLTIERTNSSRHTSRISDGEIKVLLPNYLIDTSPEAQKLIKKACDKALLLEARALLPQRIDFLSKKYGVAYKTLRIKKLKSRWGACDNHKNISLNSYLIQLDWQLIDYVICHELCHTSHPHHQQTFWRQVEKLYPNCAKAREKMRNQPMDIVPTSF